MSALATPVLPSHNLSPREVKTSAGEVPDFSYTDEAALRITLDDYSSAAAYLAQESWALQWRESRVLYQSPRGLATFEGSTVTRANVSSFMVATQVNSLAPAINAAVFTAPGYLDFRPRGRTTQNSAYAWKALINSLLDDANFEMEVKVGTETMVNQGTVIFTGGWQTERKLEKHMVRKAAPQTVALPIGDPMEIYDEEADDFKVEERVVERNRPWIEQCPLGSIYVDPKWNKPNQLHKANWIIREFYATYEDLKLLGQQNKQYTIPTEQELRAMFLEDSQKEPVLGQSGVAQQQNENGGGAIASAEAENAQTSVDPLTTPMQILERWTEDGVFTVLQQKFVMRNGRHELPGLPFWSANFWNMESTGWGMGVGRIAGADQRVDQGVKNAALDILAMAVNPEYAVSRSANLATQDMRRRLGGVRLIDGSARDAFSLIEQAQVPGDAWRVLQMSSQASNTATGADQAAVQGSLPDRGGSSIGKSGTGAAAITGASNTRIQAPVDRMLDGVILPYVDFVFEMVREFMPTSELREILGDVLSQYILVDMNDMLSARLKIDALAGTRLKARSAMSAALPFLLQVFQNQQLIAQMNQTGYKVDVMQLVGMVMDVSEWQNSREIVVKMTDQEQQSYQQSQQGPPSQLQEKSQLLSQKQQGDQQLEDMKIKGRIVAQTAKQASEHHMQTPLDRAQEYAERDQDEKQMQASQYYGGGQ